MVATLTLHSDALPRFGKSGVPGFQGRVKTSGGQSFCALSAAVPMKARGLRAATTCCRRRPFLRNVLGRYADDLDSRTPRDVHRLDHILVLHRRIALDEDDLLGTRIVDIAKPWAEPGLVDFLGVDGVLAAR